MVNLCHITYSSINLKKICVIFCRLYKCMCLRW